MFRTSSTEQWSRSYRVVLLPDKPEVIFRKIDSGTIKLEWSFKFEDKMRKTIDRHEITYFTVSSIISLLFDGNLNFMLITHRWLWYIQRSKRCTQACFYP